MAYIEDGSGSGHAAQRRAMLAGLGGLAAGAVLTRTAHAGPLDPPAGPISPTPGPEPRTPIGPDTTPGDAGSVFKITQPGSYYLMGNMSGESGKHGIVIGADNVSVDMMGFTLLGVAGSLDGVATEGVRSNLTVRNGVVSGWGQDGVNLIRGGAGGTGSFLECMHASGNSGTGLRGNNEAVVRACRSSDNGSNGFQATRNGVFESCVARGNSGWGFIATSGPCVFTGCIARDSLASHGFEAPAGSTLVGCSAVLNNTDGFRAGDGSVLIGCVARDNGRLGIRVTAGGTLSGCAATGNTDVGITVVGQGVVSECVSRDNGGVGISAGPGCSVAQCVSEGNGGHGVDAGAGCSIIACALGGNTGRGATLDAGSAIIDCVVTANADVGIYIIDNCMARGNVCSEHFFADGGVGGRGLIANGAYMRIEANHLGGNHQGFSLTGSRSVLVRNTSAGGQFSGSEQVIGPTVNHTNVSTDCNPHANYILDV